MTNHFKHRTIKLVNPNGVEITNSSKRALVREIPTLTSSSFGPLGTEAADDDKEYLPPIKPRNMKRKPNSKPRRAHKYDNWKRNRKAKRPPQSQNFAERAGTEAAHDGGYQRGGPITTKCSSSSSTCRTSVSPPPPPCPSTSSSRVPSPSLHPLLLSSKAPPLLKTPRMQKPAPKMSPTYRRVSGHAGLSLPAGTSVLPRSVRAQSPHPIGMRPLPIGAPPPKKHKRLP